MLNKKEENTQIVKDNSKKKLFYEILRFILVGGLATIADYAIFYLFRQLILPSSLIESKSWDIWSLIIATALGFIVGLVVNWLLSISFVFQDVTNKKESSSSKSFVIFTIIGVIGLAVTELGMHLGVSLIPNFSIFGIDSFLGLPIKEWMMKCIMTGIVLVWNYIARKKLIFK